MEFYCGIFGFQCSNKHISFFQEPPEPSQMLLYTNASPQSLSMLSSNPESPQLGENIESMNEKPTHKCADVKPIFMDHPYAIKDTPIALKRKLDKCSENSQDLRNKIRIINQKKRRLEKKVTSLCEVIKILKKENLISSNCVAILETLPALEKEIFKRTVKQQKGEYCEELKVFATTLQFYSTKAYNFVRKSLNLSLPHPSTVRKWYRNVHAEPGFTDCAFDSLLSSTRSSGKW